MSSAIKAEEKDEDTYEPYVKPVELASRGSRSTAVFVDYLAIWVGLWLLAALLLPRGMGLMDLVNGGSGYNVYEDPAFEAKAAELEARYEEGEADGDWNEYVAAMEKLERDWAEKANLNAADRMSLGLTTEEEGKKIVRYFLIAALCVGAFQIFQYYFLAKKGQTLGKMFMDIKVVKDPSHAPPGFVTGVLLRTMVPGFISGIPLLGGLFALVDSLMIFGADRRCLHDKIASTIVVKAS